MEHFIQRSELYTSISHQGKLVSLNDSGMVYIVEVHHCDGLLLCVTKGKTRFVVWNPYLCQTLWIKLRSPHPKLVWYSYAIGYQSSKSSRNYKTLRFIDGEAFVECEIYELNSNSWRVLQFTPDWRLGFYGVRGLCLKGNTYWFAQDRYPDQNINAFLICFNFTSERFGPRLPLPVDSLILNAVILSSVREEQLAVLFQRCDDLKIEIWVTTKIEPEVVSWSKLFLVVDTQSLIDSRFYVPDGSFFIDEEKKIVVVSNREQKVFNPTRNTAYIIGEDGYYREVDLGESTDKHHTPLVCSYVPSSVAIKQGGKRKKNV